MTIKKEGVRRVISPLDRNALEEGLRLKEAYGGKVTVVSMGSHSALDNLRESLAIGTDELVFLCDPAFARADTLVTARVLAAAIRRLGRFDLVLAGAYSFAGGTAQVGPEIAEILGIPHITRASAIEVRDGNKVRARTNLEDAYLTLEADLPALVTVFKEINTPRGISLLGIVAAQSKPLVEWTWRDLDLSPEELVSPTVITRVLAPEVKRHQEMLAGSPDDAIKTLVQNLRQGGAL